MIVFYLIAVVLMFVAPLVGGILFIVNGTRQKRGWLAGVGVAVLLMWLAFAAMIFFAANIY